MIENFAAAGGGGVVCTTAGAAVSVSGAVAAAALLTVITPFFVPNPPLFNAGVGAEMVTVVPVTENAAVAVVLPFDVVTVTFLLVRPALLAIAQLVFTVVGVDEIPVHVMPPPMFTAVAPARSLPLMATATVVPRTPEVGVIDVSEGPSNVKVTTPGLLATPIGVVTVTSLV